MDTENSYLPFEHCDRETGEKSIDRLDLQKSNRIFSLVGMGQSDDTVENFFIGQEGPIIEKK